MSQAIYSGKSAFENDAGTLWPFHSDQPPLILGSVKPRQSKKLVRTIAAGKPIIWFIDDEKANRQWFVEQHRRYFCIITFSNRGHFDEALDNKIPCHAVVTDIFFPAKPFTTDKEADDLLSIYEKIDDSLVKDLSTLWQHQKALWVLDGFSIAKRLAKLKPPIPVFLFSRKALLLLRLPEFVGEPPAVRNSYWLIEKVNPIANSDISRLAADMQRDRIISALTPRSSLWRRLLFSIKPSLWPPGASVDLKEFLTGGG